MDIVLATGNEHKRSEMEMLLNKCGGYNIRLLSLKDIGFSGDIIEDGTTFEENAKIKTDAVSKYTNLPVLADDSGLCVDALGGAPGIHSARYADGHSDNAAGDAANIKKLLREMENIENEKRTAHFYCALCCKIGNEYYFDTGRADGIILRESHGENGFGYDSVFFFPPLLKTFAQLSPEEKNKYSHRAKATELFMQNTVKYILN